MIIIKFGQNIRELREKRNMTQRQLAQAADISYYYVGRIERGERTGIRIDIVSRLAKELGVAPAALFKE